MLFLVPAVLAGCGGNSVPAADTDPLAETYRRGRVDVICLQGMNEERGEPDTLFGCLLAAREKGLGTVDLPPGVYLGHVSEFIVRSLEYYELEQHFERFYGYRIVLTIREARVSERKEREARQYSGILLGAAGDVALGAAGVAAPPLAPVIFLYKSAVSEAERRDLAREAREKGLPEPTRSGPEATLRGMGRSYSELWSKAERSMGGGDSRDHVLEVYLVEECYLQKPSSGEIVELAGKLAPADD
jgi:hypothetical protein